ncbi:MAG TPA: hypothetical protein VFE62_01900 [Gemmataceae bacterium]|nr:hypothetical protein [Gemmataceae bacterium]
MIRNGELEPGERVPKDRGFPVLANGKKVGGSVRVHNEKAVWTLLGFSASAPAPAVIGPSSAANGTTAAPQPIVMPPDQTRRAAPTSYSDLGIEVDWKKKTVRKGNKTIEFERSEVQWHIFRVALNAYPDAFSLKVLAIDYPGEPGKVARQVATMHLNKKLSRLGLIVRNRQLIEIGKTSG